MKKFISKILILVPFLLLGSEIIIRVFNLSEPSLNRVIEEGITIYTPHQAGSKVFGNIGDIRAKYSINAQGYNSVYNYDDIFEGKKYAIVGDSFVEGFHEDVVESIGRRLESLMPLIRVHEYGRSGWNAHNYLQVCDMIFEEYDKIFIICDTSDFMYESPDHHRVNNSFMRSLLLKSRLFCYLYYNRGFGKILAIQNSNNSDELPGKSDVLKHVGLFQNRFPDNVVWVWREIQSSALESERCIIINHVLQPYNFGQLDGHWNSNGRQNVAENIFAYLRKYGD